MQFSIAVAAVALLARGFASPIASPRHVVHEKRAQIPRGWTQQGNLDPNFVLPMRIGLAQQNLDRAHEFIHDVSDPKSKNFGKHWTPKQVAETFAPRYASLLLLKINLTVV
jgi:tripeptidyl-peptidase I